MKWFGIENHIRIFDWWSVLVARNSASSERDKQTKNAGDDVRVVVRLA